MVINIHDGGKVRPKLSHRFTVNFINVIHQTTDLLHFDPGTVPIVKRTSKGEFLVNAGTFGVIAVTNGISNVCILYHIIRNFTSPLTQFSATPSGVGKDSPQRSDVHLSVCHRVVRGHNTGTHLQPVGPAVRARNTISCESSLSLSFFLSLPPLLYTS